MTGGNPAKKGMRIMTQNVAAQKRTVATSAKKEGLSVQDLILVAVLIAAGAVLKLTVSSFLSFAGMKPNFMIAMYCLAIILTRPKVYQSVVIGLLVGLVSQLPMLNATPLVNIASRCWALWRAVCWLPRLRRWPPTTRVSRTSLLP